MDGKRKSAIIPYFRSLAHRTADFGSAPQKNPDKHFIIADKLTGYQIFLPIR